MHHHQPLVSGAMTPGNDIRISDVVIKRCVRCGWRFYGGDGNLCAECIENPLYDREEKNILKNTKERFDFMGWGFSVKRFMHLPNQVEPKTYLVCYKRLFNPEREGLVISQANFNNTMTRKDSYQIRYAAAWLIAHWWEHYLEICPCLKGERDDDEDSNFRRAVIESLMWYSENIESLGQLS